MQNPSRPKFSVYIATSIDGFIAAPDGNVEFLAPFQTANEDYGYQIFFDSVDALILGRKTYEAVTKFEQWPYPHKRVIVLSHEQDILTEQIELYSGEPESLANKLAQEGVRHVWVDGGSLISQFLNAQLIDQMILSVVPVILGSGVPLFQSIQRRLPCRMVYSQSYPNGLIKIHYDVSKPA